MMAIVNAQFLEIQSAEEGPWGFGQTLFRGYLGWPENVAGSPSSVFLDDQFLYTVKFLKSDLLGFYCIVLTLIIGLAVFNLVI
jgi:hypothetical protein